MYSTRDDINTLLLTANNSLVDITNSYQALLQQKQIPNALLVEVKEVISNLKSALDFKSNELSKNNFPIRNGEKDLESIIKDFPDKYKKFLISIRPFEDWWTDFNELNNKNKHVALVPQKRIERRVKTITHGQAGIQIGQGASIQMDEGASISIDGAIIPGGQTLAPDTAFYGDARLTVTEETWVDFLFDNSEYPNLSNDISVLPFLTKCFEETVKVIKAMENIEPQHP